MNPTSSQVLSLSDDGWVTPSTQSCRPGRDAGPRRCRHQLPRPGPVVVPTGWSVVNRYYDPATDQFLSVDPDVATTGQPYAFTGDDPLNSTDPLGLMAPTPGDYRWLRQQKAHQQYCKRHPGIRGHSCGGLVHEIRGTLVKGARHARSAYDGYVANATSTAGTKQLYDNTVGAVNDIPGSGAINRIGDDLGGAVSTAVSKIPGANWVDSNVSSTVSCIAGGLVSGGIVGDVAEKTIPAVRSYLPALTKGLDDSVIGAGLVGGSALLGCAFGGDVNP